MSEKSPLSYWPKRILNSLAIFGPPKEGERPWIAYLRIAISVAFLLLLFGITYDVLDEEAGALWAVERSSEKVKSAVVPDIVICPSDYNNITVKFKFSCGYYSNNNVTWFSSDDNGCPHVSPASDEYFKKEGCQVVHPPDFKIATTYRNVDSSEISAYKLVVNFTDESGNMFNGTDHDLWAEVYILHSSLNYFNNYNATLKAEEENPYITETLGGTYAYWQSRIDLKFILTEWTYFTHESSWLGQLGIPFAYRAKSTTVDTLNANAESHGGDGHLVIDIEAKDEMLHKKLYHTTTALTILSTIGGIFSALGAVYVCLFGAKRMRAGGIVHTVAPGRGKAKPSERALENGVVNVMSFGKSPEKRQVRVVYKKSPGKGRGGVRGSEKPPDKVLKKLQQIESQINTVHKRMDTVQKRMEVVQDFFLNMDGLIEDGSDAITAVGEIFEKIIDN